MSGKAIRETLAALGVIASMVFVGFEIRQNTIAGRSAAYMEIGIATGESWQAQAHGSVYAELVVLSRDTSRWNEIDEAGWVRLAAKMTEVMRRWETVYLQVEQGLLPDDAMERLGFGVSPRVYWPTTLDRLWPQVRNRMDPEFATYIETRFGLTP